MVTKIVFEQSVLVLPQSIMWSGTYWSPWIAHTWINKLLPLHSSLGVLHAHHRVNTPMDRLHINTGARCTSVVPLEKQHWSHMFFHAVGNTEYLSFSPSPQQALPPSLCPLVCCGAGKTAQPDTARLNSLQYCTNVINLGLPVIVYHWISSRICELDCETSAIV